MPIRTTDDIPEELRREVAQAVQPYSVCLLGAVGDPKTGHFKFCGSGTLVLNKGAHHILTGAHVWKEIETCQGLGLTIRDYPHSFIHPTRVFSPFVLRIDSFGEWGPDLALIRIPPNLVPDISVRKSFYNLAPRQERARSGTLLSATSDTIWAVVGAPEEMSKVQSQAADLTAVVFFSKVERIHDRREHDYYDLSVLPSSRVPLPRSYGGVSGGGLWAFPVETLADGSVRWNEEGILAGVAFYQIGRDGDRGSIRCHGPRSLYEVFCR